MCISVYKEMMDADQTIVNVLVLETTGIVESVETERYNDVLMCVRNLILFVSAIYYVVVLTLCWSKN
jgi:hypothetical protein